MCGRGLGLALKAPRRGNSWPARVRETISPRTARVKCAGNSPQPGTCACSRRACAARSSRSQSALYPETGRRSDPESTGGGASKCDRGWWQRWVFHKGSTEGRPRRGAPLTRKEHRAACRDSGCGIGVWPRNALAGRVRGGAVQHSARDTFTFGAGRGGHVEVASPECGRPNNQPRGARPPDHPGRPPRGRSRRPLRTVPSAGATNRPCGPVGVGSEVRAEPREDDDQEQQPTESHSGADRDRHRQHENRRRPRSAQRPRRTERGALTMVSHAPAQGSTRVLGVASRSAPDGRPAGPDGMCMGAAAHTREVSPLRASMASLTRSPRSCRNPSVLWGSARECRVGQAAGAIPCRRLTIASATSETELNPA
jgi:hypothetical protein